MQKKVLLKWLFSHSIYLGNYLAASHVIQNKTMDVRNKSEEIFESYFYTA